MAVYNNFTDVTGRQGGARGMKRSLAYRKYRGAAHNNRGFTLIELLIVMAISLFVLLAASQVMISMTNQFKQQSRIALKSMESGFGIDLLKSDIYRAGFGLPTGIFSNTVIFDETNWISLKDSYLELNDGAEPMASKFDDARENSGIWQAPKMITGGAQAGGSFNDSDRLVIKGASLGFDPIAGKFNIFRKDGSDYVKNSLSLGYTTKDVYRSLMLNSTDSVIVITTRDPDNMGLEISNSSSYQALYEFTDVFGPFSAADPSIIYGIRSNFDGSATTTLRAPFNRVDYYISDEDVPGKCAPGMGVLYRAQMNHSDGRLGKEVKIMDCVADMQLKFFLNGVETYDLSIYSAKKIRDELGKVEVYILTHDGNFDRNYTYDDPDVGTIKVANRDFPIADVVGSSVLVYGEPVWKRYRWRVIKVTERPALK